jgi:Uma2 family endonuclease
MAAAIQFPGPMMLEAFLKWDSPGGFLWQLLDGVPVAMSPPAPLHGAIQAEVARLIGNHLLERGSSCLVITTPGVVPRRQPDRNFLIPDLAVTCSAADMAGKALRDPVLLIEILSPSNHAETWANVQRYKTIPALREILVIHTSRAGVDLLRRADDDTWPEQPPRIDDGTFTLSSIGLTLPLAALYRGTGLAV